MKSLSIEAIYPKPKTTTLNLEHRVYPYLLRGLRVDHPNQVWTSDITYIPLRNGFMYLVAVLDWHTRYVLSWRLSNTLDGPFCREALEEALLANTPEIFNTDQGASSRPRLSHVAWSKRVSKSVWMGKVGHLITCSWTSVVGVNRKDF